jgi:hypothetical protein
MGLFVGPNGSGKTIAAASFPGPIMVWDFDGRIEPIKAFYPKRDDIEYWTVGLDGDTRSDVIGFTDWTKRFEDLQDSCPYSTIIMDSYTAYSATACFHQMGLHAGDVKRTKGGLAIPDWDEYKGETGVMLQTLEIAKILPCHFICTAHPISKARTTKQGGSTNEVLASMVRASTLATYGWKTDSFLPNYFNEIYYFYTDVTSQVAQPNSYKIQTVSAGEIVGKTALGLPHTIDVTSRPFYPILQNLLKERELALIEKLEKDKAKEAAANG